MLVLIQFFIKKMKMEKKNRSHRHNINRPRYWHIYNIYKKCLSMVIRKHLSNICSSMKTELRILTGKNHRQIKLQRLQKVQIWAFGLLVHQYIKSTPFIVIDPFCSHHSICLNNGFWYGSFVWKWCVFNLSASN